MSISNAAEFTEPWNPCLFTFPTQQKAKEAPEKTDEQQTEAPDAGLRRRRWHVASRKHPPPPSSTAAYLQTFTDYASPFFYDIAEPQTEPLFEI